MGPKFAVCFFLLFSSVLRAEQPATYLEAAQKAATWLRAVAVTTPHGKSWPPDPKEPATVSNNLYHGNAGIVLFFVYLYKVTGNQADLDDAVAGADHLLATLPAKLEHSYQAGLYTGVGGIGFVLEEVYRLTGQPKFRQGARTCVSLILEKTKNEGEIAHLGEVTDIISGQAGIGLFLLYAAERMDHTGALATAGKIGRFLVHKAIRSPEGWYWKMRPDYERLMHNFSHGTAGVAFFLAHLHARTKVPVFLEGAREGGRFLLGITGKDGLIHHHDPDGENLFYLGWCHGPAGTSRLFRKLWLETHDPAWREAMTRSVDAMLHSGIPLKRPPGFWNNVGQCCGSSGVAECALTTFHATGKNAYLDFAREVTADLLTRATQEKSGLKWIQAEHRIKPELLIAQTGYMQGAAGIGIWLLKLHAFEKDLKLEVRFPDTP